MTGDISYTFPDFRNRLFEHGLLPPNLSMIFLTGNCALVEHYTGRSYGYRAIAVDTLESKHLFYRNSKLEHGAHKKTAEQITRLPFYTEMSLPSLRQRAHNILSDVFSLILPKYGFLYRQNQLKLSRAMLDSIWERRLSLCEAGVGSGKTLAYLVAAVVYDLFGERQIPTIISTSTIALQKAITKEYIPQLSDILMAHRVTEKPLTYLVRKGKSHYISGSSMMLNEDGLIVLLSKTFPGSVEI